jgi:ribulose-5-phosphate 4-epimerase/fuculose-1-phosphate aldolase
MTIPQLIADLVTASHILAAEGIVDSFGHISARHPAHPDRFFISCVRAAELVTAEDIIELDLNCQPIAESKARLFAERVLHAAVYRFRPDVMSVCHHHAPSILPFCVTGVPLVPVVHLGATMGASVPFWSSRDEFGDTNLLISSEEQSISMARTLGSLWTVLLRHHGATVAGRSIRECVFRSVYGAHNASVQLSAMRLGPITPLTPGEAAAAEAFNLLPIAIDRTWDRWRHRAAQTSSASFQAQQLELNHGDAP